MHTHVVEDILFVLIITYVSIYAGWWCNFAFKYVCTRMSFCRPCKIITPLMISLIVLQLLYKSKNLVNGIRIKYNHCFFWYLLISQKSIKNYFQISRPSSVGFSNCHPLLFCKVRFFFSRSVIWKLFYLNFF